MPPVCRYHAIIIIINSGREHPPPHIHVRYKDYESVIEIPTGNYYRDSKRLPKFAHKFVQEWLNENRQEVLRQWERMERGEKVEYVGRSR